MWPELADALGLVREPLPALGAVERLRSLGVVGDEATTLLEKARASGQAVHRARGGQAGFVVVRTDEGLVLLHSREAASPQVMALHELANAMTVVGGLAERALHDLGGGPARDARDEMLDRIARTARDGMHVARLVERADAEGSERRVVAGGDAAATLARVIDGLRPFAARRDVRLAPEIDLAGVVADEHALAAVAWNLLKNAIEASPPGGVVSVTALAHDGALDLDVLDEGTGIEARPRKRRGRGVGLAVTRTLLDGLGGSMELAPRAPRGTRAHVVVPMTSESVAASPPPRSGVGPRARVLVVEDDPALRRLVTERLGELGWYVRATADPFTVLSSAAHFDLALVDLHLHGEVLTETTLRALRERVPVVVAVTGDPDARLGVDHVLRKPFDLDDLVDLVERLTSGVERGRGAKVVYPSG